jgi:hypothetical protein
MVGALYLPFYRRNIFSAVSDFQTKNRNLGPFIDLILLILLYASSVEASPPPPFHVKTVWSMHCPKILEIKITLLKPKLYKM